MIVNFSAENKSIFDFSGEVCLHFPGWTVLFPVEKTTQSFKEWFPVPNGVKSTTHFKKD